MAERDRTIRIPYMVDAPDAVIVDEPRVQAVVCTELKESTAKVREQFCGHYAVYVPKSSGLRRDLCFYHLKSHIGHEGIRTWATAMIAELRQNPRLGWVNLQGAEFIGSRHLPLDFPDDTRFEGVYLDQARFLNCRMQLFYLFSPHKLVYTRFEDCDLQHATFEVAELDAVSFIRCDLSNSVWVRPTTVASSVRFHHTKLTGCRITTLVLLNVTLDDVDLTGTSIKHLNVIGGMWKNIDLSRTQIAPENVFFPEPVKIDNCTFNERFEPFLKKWQAEGSLIPIGPTPIRISRETIQWDIDDPADLDIEGEVISHSTDERAEISPDFVSSISATARRERRSLQQIPTVEWILEHIWSASGTSLLLTILWVVLRLPGIFVASLAGFVVGFVPALILALRPRWKDTR